MAAAEVREAARAGEVVLIKSPSPCGLLPASLLVLPPARAETTADTRVTLVSVAGARPVERCPGRAVSPPCALGTLNELVLAPLAADAFREVAEPLPPRIRGRDGDDTVRMRA